MRKSQERVLEEALDSEIQVSESSDSQEFDEREARAVEPQSPLTPVISKKTQKKRETNWTKPEGVGIASLDVRKMVGNQSEESLQKIFVDGIDLVSVDDWKEFRTLILARLRKQRLLSRNYLRVFTQKTSWLVSIWCKIKEEYELQSSSIIKGLKTSAAEFSVWKSGIQVIPIQTTNPETGSSNPRFTGYMSRLASFTEKADMISSQLLSLCTRIEQEVGAKLQTILTKDTLIVYQEALRQAFESLSASQSECWRVLAGCESPPQGMEMMAFGLSNRNPYHQEFRLVSLMRRYRELLDSRCVESLAGIHSQMKTCLEGWAGELQTQLEEFEKIGQTLFVGWSEDFCSNPDVTSTRSRIEQRYPIIEQLKEGIEMVSKVEADHAALIKAKLLDRKTNPSEEVDIQDISEFFDGYSTPYPQITSYILQSLLVARGKWESSDLLLMSLDVFGVLALKRVSIPPPDADKTRVELTVVRSPKHLKSPPQVISTHSPKNLDLSHKDTSQPAIRSRESSGESPRSREASLGGKSSADPDVKSLLRSAGDSILLMVPVNKVELRFDSKLVKIDFTILGSDGQVTKVDEYYTADMKETVQFLNGFYGLQNKFQKYYFPECQFKK